MRLFALLLLLTLSCTVLHTTHETIVVRELSRIDGADNVWMVESFFAGGSGFPVSCRPTDDGRWRVIFLTAKHMTSDFGMSYTAQHHDGRLLTGYLIDQHPVEDVAVLEFDADFPVTVRYLSFVPVEFGEKIVLSGYPELEGPFVSSGVASLEGYGTFHSFPGTSGGPVAREDGSVVGVQMAVYTVEGYGPVTFMSRYVPMTKIERWLDELLQ